MHVFDFITSPDFRQSLESDYAEMRTCAKESAWKSVQILAGSIIEALLVDYLVATNEPPRAGVAPLRMDLSQAIAVCLEEKILTQRSADLSSVVRSYRNLIHPGRLVRLEEAQPNRASAEIAVALVDIIVEEVAKRRKEKFGLTPEQVLSKIERDSNCLPYLKHLLADVNERDRERLLLRILPDRYNELADEDDSAPFTIPSPTLPRIQKAYRIVYEAATDEHKAKAAAEFVRVLREADGETVTRYRRAFFQVQDMKYVAEQHRSLVKQHLLSTVAPHHTAESATAYGDLVQYLTVSEMQLWTDSYLRSLSTSALSDETKASIQSDFLLAVAFMADDKKEILKRRMKDWALHHERHGHQTEVEELNALLKYVDEADLPF
jgi:hypothetical protein